MSLRGMLAVVIVFVLAGLYFSVKKGILFEKAYPLDLSNRIVGARLQKDGIDPYFYKWKPEDGTRYYDYINFDTFTVSRSTASPFFHELMYPVVELPQREISKIWLVLHYVVLALMVLIACQLTPSFKRRLTIVVLAACFLYTEGFNDLIAAGQLYLIIAFLGLLFYYFISTARKNDVRYALAGVVAAFLLLVRPTTIFFFLPFLFLLKQYTVKQKTIFFVSFALLPVCLCMNAEQRFFWGQYQKSIREQIKIHQYLNPTVVEIIPDPLFKEWEGWNRASKDSAWYASAPMRHSEKGNLFYLVEHAFKTRPSVEALMILFFTLSFVLFIVFFRSRQSGYLFNTAIFGWCIYMLSDFLSPVTRFQYYSVQWFFPLFLIAVYGSPQKKRINSLLFIGLVLNIIDTTYIKMEHTMGEYLWLICLLYYAITYMPMQKNINNQNQLSHA